GRASPPGSRSDRTCRTPWFFTSLAAGIAVQVATAAIGIREQALWVVALGIAVLAGVVGVQSWRFRQINGVWLGGFASRVVLGTGTLASVSYAAAFGAAVAGVLPRVAAGPCPRRVPRVPRPARRAQPARRRPARADRRRGLGRGAVLDRDAGLPRQDLAE